MVGLWTPHLASTVSWGTAASHRLVSLPTTTRKHRIRGGYEGQASQAVRLGQLGLAIGRAGAIMAERGGALVLAQPTVLAAAKLSKKLYMPSALVKERMPAGLGELQTVPRLMDSKAKTPAARLLQGDSGELYRDRPL